MKLEVGKRYVLRNGNKTGPLNQDGITFYGRDTTENAMRTWGQHGEWYYYHDRTEEDADAYDIVAEYLEPDPSHDVQQPLRWVKNCKPDRVGHWAYKFPEELAWAYVDVHWEEQMQNSANGLHWCYLGPIPEILPPVKKVVERLWVYSRDGDDDPVFVGRWIAESETVQPAKDWIRTDRTREREI